MMRFRRDLQQLSLGGPAADGWRVDGKREAEVSGCLRLISVVKTFLAQRRCALLKMKRYFIRRREE